MLSGRERKLVWLALRVLLISVGVAIGAGLASAAEQKPRRPTLSVKVHPAVGFMPFVGKYHVVATILLLDPDKTISCPGFVVFWDSSGTDKSIRESECDGDRQTRYRVTIEHDYARPWSGEIEVAMLDVGEDGEDVQIRATTALRILIGCDVFDESGRCV